MASEHQRLTSIAPYKDHMDLGVDTFRMLEIQDGGWALAE
jgi:hypothetical protein